MAGNVANLRPFPKGVSGHPSGRPVGALTALNAKFVKALAKDFQQHGADAIRQAREQDPLGYVRVIASLAPRDVRLDVGGGLVEALQELGRIALARSRARLEPAPAETVTIDAERVQRD